MPAIRAYDNRPSAVCVNAIFNRIFVFLSCTTRTAGQLIWKPEIPDTDSDGMAWRRALPDAVGWVTKVIARFEEK
jgi:hypothetical protein